MKKATVRLTRVCIVIGTPAPSNNFAGARVHITIRTIKILITDI
jgi:hypothetical protein